jgi:hypothetical protein
LARMRWKEPGATFWVFADADVGIFDSFVDLPIRHLNERDRLSASFTVFTKRDIQASQVRIDQKTEQLPTSSRSASSV